MARILFDLFCVQCSCYWIFVLCSCWWFSAQVWEQHNEQTLLISNIQCFVHNHANILLVFVMKAGAACNFDIIVTPAHLSSICNFIELAIYKLPPFHKTLLRVFLLFTVFISGVSNDILSLYCRKLRKRLISLLHTLPTFHFVWVQTSSLCDIFWQLWKTMFAFHDYKYHDKIKRF